MKLNVLIYKLLSDLTKLINNKKLLWTDIFFFYNENFVSCESLRLRTKFHLFSVIPEQTKSSLKVFNYYFFQTVFTTELHEFKNFHLIFSVYSLTSMNKIFSWHLYQRYWKQRKVHWNQLRSVFTLLYNTLDSGLVPSIFSFIWQIKKMLAHCCFLFNVRFNNEIS